MTSTTDKLRVGLIGLGHHGLMEVVPAIGQIATCCNLMAVCDADPSRLAAVDLPGVQRLSDHRKLLQLPGLEVVYLCVPVQLHRDLALEAFAAGLHVVCEKPLAETQADCRTMIAAAQAAERRLTTIFNNRYKPHYRQLRSWVREGLLGNVEAIHCQHLWDGHKANGLNSEAASARRQRALDHNGSMDCDIHEVDLIRYFVGGDWQDIHAMGAWFGEQVCNAPHLSVMARLSSGTYATLNGSYAYGAYIKPRVTSSVWTLVGSRGVVHHVGDEQMRSALHLVTDRLETSVPYEDIRHRHDIAWLMDDLAAVLRGGTSDILPTGEDGLAAQMLAEEVLRQTRQQRGPTGDQYHNREPVPAGSRKNIGRHASA